MNGRPVVGRAAAFLVSIMLMGSILHGQLLRDTSVIDVLQSQLRVLGEEICNQLNLESSSRLGLFVEGTDKKSIVENAFIELLSKKDLNVALTRENVKKVLELFVVTQTVSYESLATEGWKRTIQTRLEARLRSIPGDETRYLGSHEATKLDTVRQREEGWIQSENRQLLGGSPPSTLERMLMPLTVIVASVLVVYLFFTVRN
jgi:hypothetical protein